MVYGYQLTYDEILDILDLKYVPTSTIGYTLPLALCEIIDIKLMLKSLLPKEVKVSITIETLD